MRFNDQQIYDNGPAGDSPKSPLLKWTLMPIYFRDRHGEAPYLPFIPETHTNQMQNL